METIVDEIGTVLQIVKVNLQKYQQLLKQHMPETASTVFVLTKNDIGRTSLSLATD